MQRRLDVVAVKATSFFFQKINVKSANFEECVVQEIMAGYTSVLRNTFERGQIKRRNGQTDGRTDPLIKMHGHI